MPVWISLIFTLGWNYRRHRQGKSTLCSCGRRFIPAWAFKVGWSVLSEWLVPHYCNPAKFKRGN